MAALKDSYPLYLANEAQTPNLDLEVTDKYTGKVATRVALADAKIIDAGIAANRPLGPQHNSAAVHATRHQPVCHNLRPQLR